MPRDLYKILRVPHSASIKEIKSSYRKLALRFHPDTHDGDQDKTEQFRVITEAYTVLSDEKKKDKYDLKMGFRFNKNRRMPPPPNYRSVEFPDPPKDWKMVWDHKLHHDMHYGDGLYEEIIRKAMKKMKKEGLFEYRSPIGKGFTFSKTDPSLNKNPYNQNKGSGLRDHTKVEFIFEEYGFGASMNDTHSGPRSAKEHLQRRVRIVKDLHERRDQRREYQSVRKKQQEKKSRENSAFQTKGESCIIL